MLVTVEDINVLNNYLGHIEWGLTHHAEHLREVVPYIAWSVLSRMDAGQPIEVHERRSANGHPAIAAAVWIGGLRYSIAYNRRMGRVVTLREGSRVGPILYVFTPNTTAAEVRAVFEALQPEPETMEVA